MLNESLMPGASNTWCIDAPARAAQLGLRMMPVHSISNLTDTIERRLPLIVLLRVLWVALRLPFSGNKWDQHR